MEHITHLSKLRLVGWWWGHGDPTAGEVPADIRACELRRTPSTARPVAGLFIASHLNSPHQIDRKQLQPGIIRIFSLLPPGRNLSARHYSVSGSSEIYVGVLGEGVRTLTRRSPLHLLCRFSPPWTYMYPVTLVANADTLNFLKKRRRYSLILLLSKKKTTSNQDMTYWKDSMAITIPSAEVSVRRSLWRKTNWKVSVNWINNGENRQRGGEEKWKFSHKENPKFWNIMKSYKNWRNKDYLMRL